MAGVQSFKMCRGCTATESFTPLTSVFRWKEKIAKIMKAISGVDVSCFEKILCYAEIYFSLQVSLEKDKNDVLICFQCLQKMRQIIDLGDAIKDADKMFFEAARKTQEAFGNDQERNWEEDGQGLIIRMGNINNQQVENQRKMNFQEQSSQTIESSKGSFEVGPCSPDSLLAAEPEDTEYKNVASAITCQYEVMEGCEPLSDGEIVNEDEEHFTEQNSLLEEPEGHERPHFIQEPQSSTRECCTTTDQRIISSQSSNGYERREYSCVFCENMFPSKRQYKRHKKKVHGGTSRNSKSPPTTWIVACNFCEATMESPAQLIQHQNEFHRISKLLECNNGETFTYVEKEESWAIECCFCDERVEKLDEILKHQENYHKMLKFGRSCNDGFMFVEH